MENKIKEYRKKRGLTQDEMAKMLSVSRQTYINYESGEAEPSFNTLKQISRLLSTPIDDLLDNNIYPSERDKTKVSLINDIEDIIKKYK